MATKMIFGLIAGLGLGTGRMVLWRIGWRNTMLTVLYYCYLLPQSSVESAGC